MIKIKSHGIKVIFIKYGPAHTKLKKLKISTIKRARQYEPKNKKCGLNLYFFMVHTSQKY